MNQRQNDPQAEIAALRRDVAYLVERQRRMDDLFDEMMPIMKIFMEDASERLEALEKRGYVDFGKELIRVADRVVESYSPEDVRQLGDNVVSILDTVRRVTQPDVMTIVHEATNAITDDESEEQGLFGMLRASRDKDVRKGLGVVLGMLRHVGRAADEMVASATNEATRVTALRRPGLARMLAPRRRAPRAGVPRLPAPRQAVASAPAAPASEVVAPPPVPQEVGEVAGLKLCPVGFLADSSTWTKEFAEAMAVHNGITLTEAHWDIVNHARGVYDESGTAANVRALAKGASISTRDIYKLFPRAPGKTVAKIAGTPKPAGCL